MTCFQWQTPSPSSLIFALSRSSVVETILKNELVLVDAALTGKVDVDAKDKFGRTPLSWAAENCQQSTHLSRELGIRVVRTTAGVVGTIYGYKDT